MSLNASTVLSRMEQRTILHTGRTTGWRDSDATDALARDVAHVLAMNPRARRVTVELDGLDYNYTVEFRRFSRIR